MPKNHPFPTFETKRDSSPARRDRNDNQRYFARTDPARTDDRDDFIRAKKCASRARHHFFPVGTFCLSSSNQFSTTLICVGAACACSTGLSIKNRWPSGDTAY